MSVFKSVLLCVPTTSLNMRSGTAVALVELVKELQAAGVQVDIHNIDSAEIVTARDMFANLLLHSSRWDSLLFVDSDMAFAPSLALRLVQRGVPVAAAACPRRSLDLRRLISGVKAGHELDNAIAFASDFTVKLNWSDQKERPWSVDGGFCQAAAVGMACAFISKAALEAMVKAKCVRPRLDLDAGGPTCWSFFENLEVNGERLGEDYSFCRRWTGIMRRELWVCVDEPVTHIGTYNFTARYADML